MAEPAPETLNEAVTQGIITAAQADAIRTLGLERAGRDEPVQLVSSFSDLFLCLGLFIIYWSMSAFTVFLAGDPVIVWAAFAVLFWVLAEIFVFRSRQKFPAVVCVFLFIWLAARIYLGTVGLEGGEFDPEEIIAGRGSIGLIGAVTAAFAVTLLRFRLPILVLGVAVGAVMIIFTVAMRHVQPLAAFSVLALCGATLLMIGAWLDYRDRPRTGPQHEWALWLFVVGSPLTVHGLMLYMMKDYLPTVLGFAAAGASVELLADQMGGLVLTVSALALMFTVLGLILDRRSLVASSLFYFTAVLTYAAWRADMGMGAISAIIPLGIGLAVIILGLAWNTLRRQILRIVPVSRWVRPA